jgi:predicted nucleic acid-binding protein
LIVLVIDASAAVQASLPSDGFALLDQEELIAPALLWSEVPSVLHEMAWRGTISRGLGRAALERFLAAPIGPGAMVA